MQSGFYYYRWLDGWLRDHLKCIFEVPRNA